MRRSKHQMIEEARERASRRGKRSQEVRCNNRLSAALRCCSGQALERGDRLKPELRASLSFLVFELATRNPRSGAMHYIEIRHELGDGADRFSVYLDGARWRNGWSRSRFCGWLFKQIESVRVDWQ